MPYTATQRDSYEEALERAFRAVYRAVSRADLMQLDAEKSDLEGISVVLAALLEDSVNGRTRRPQARRDRAYLSVFKLDDRSPPA